MKINIRQNYYYIKDNKDVEVKLTIKGEYNISENFINQFAKIKEKNNQFFYFDYYYDLNDDVLMKDILAGVYTGMPEGHNIQMLWPVSAFISLLYKLAPNLPCYGLFLCACQYGSIGLILCRSLSFCEKRWSKVLVSIVEIVLAAGLMLTPLIAVQYTITCTMLASCAAFFIRRDSAIAE